MKEVYDRMNYYKKMFKHFKTITKHKLLVMKYCFKLGLYKQGLLHDNSKYSPVEFFTSVKYYQGTRSPIDAEKEQKGYSLVWQHHKGHNPHHWEYWIDNIGPRDTIIVLDGKAHFGHVSKPIALEIPLNYVLEMICDWISAGKTYLGKNWTQHEPYRYYMKEKDNRLINKDTQVILETILKLIDTKGIDETFYILKHKYGKYFGEDKTIKSWKQQYKNK